MAENKIWLKIRTFSQECLRVLRVTKKPDRAEFMTIVKMSGLGMIVIGLIGFIISMAKILVFN